jgi:hypothetical protein
VGISDIPPQNSPRTSETNRYRTEPVAKSISKSQSLHSIAKASQEHVNDITERVQDLGSQGSLGSRGMAKSTPNLIAPKNLVTSNISQPIQNPDAAAAMSPFNKANLAQTQSMSLPALNAYFLFKLVPKNSQMI